jgi:hypothetical protein
MSESEMHHHRCAVPRRCISLRSYTLPSPSSLP